MSLGPADAELLRVIQHAMNVASERSGEMLRCGRGCFGCCIGPFPITNMDAARLRAGLRALANSGGQAALRITRRASEAVSQLESAGYREGMDDELFEARFQMIPCPVLDLESGACLLYEWRPLACRTYGPAIVWQGQAMPHCQLNYQGASVEAIEAARVVVDVDEVAEAAYREYEDAGGTEGKTVVALAVAGSQ